MDVVGGVAIASSIVYLASAEARMITGSVVAFDGGMG